MCNATEKIGGEVICKCFVFATTFKSVRQYQGSDSMSWRRIYNSLKSR